MNLKKYKKILFDTFSLDLKKISNFGKSIYSVINLLSRRSDHLDIYLKLLLNMKFQLFVDENSYDEEYEEYEEYEPFEEFVTNKGKIKLSKKFEKISKPTSIAIIEYLKNELYFISLKKIIYQNYFIKVYINKLLKKLIKKLLKKEKKEFKKKNKNLYKKNSIEFIKLYKKNYKKKQLIIKKKLIYDKIYYRSII
ncbi:hypothetical protein [Candidatus Karelsulcia muelleri]|uniref:hypothetical protein n=1 Tax=Candidatus Karelsulcia muelleri TaxID=336810 RepID=UPI0007F995B6|nr:hypothetical protein [Candidatus Karelsulcia muelleri]ANO35760.1 hypothetical protein BA057_00685 [Candidatus Karelsulcia muelleri]QSF25150.1 hypothetical protein CU085_00695 [Candidatus Karelsulcia muelleri]WKD87288.1 hypothetical protein QUR94_00135 [Candidatus Karelsulcia muelleri]BEH03716.1 hypothetical protein SMNC_0680 [Candidatus Karelsulcia muelleri]